MMESEVIGYLSEVGGTWGPWILMAMLMASGAGIPLDEQALPGSDSQRVRRHRLELFVGNLHQPEPSLEQLFTERNRQQR